MGLTYILLFNAHAYEPETPKERNSTGRFEFGVCAGFTSDCLLPSFKFGGVYKSLGLGISISAFYGFSSSLSFRFYGNSDPRIRPYAYVGYGGAVSFIGGGGSVGAGVGVDLILGPLVIQPSVGVSMLGSGGALSLLVKI